MTLANTQRPRVTPEPDYACLSYTNIVLAKPLTILPKIFVFTLKLAGVPRNDIRNEDLRVSMIVIAKVGIVNWQKQI